MTVEKRTGLLMLSVIFIALIPSGCLESVHANEGYTDVLITKKFIDVSKDASGESNSHYVLVTDKGNFEVDRPFLDTFNTSRNPDTVYGNIIEGKKYRLHHYGYSVNFLYEYPYVVEAVPMGQ